MGYYIFYKAYGYSVHLIQWLWYTWVRWCEDMMVWLWWCEWWCRIEMIWWLNYDECDHRPCLCCDGAKYMAKWSVAGVTSNLRSSPASYIMAIVTQIDPGPTHIRGSIATAGYRSNVDPSSLWKILHTFYSSGENIWKRDCLAGCHITCVRARYDKALRSDRQSIILHSGLSARSGLHERSDQ